MKVRKKPPPLPFRAPVDLSNCRRVYLPGPDEWQGYWHFLQQDSWLRPLRRLLKILALAFLLYMLLLPLFLFRHDIGFHYPVWIENQPLKTPLTNSRVDGKADEGGSRLHLAAGRIIKFEYGYFYWYGKISPGDQIE